MIDKTKIAELAKARGLNVAEDAAGQLAELAVDIVNVVVTDSDTPIDDMLWLPMEKKVREELLKLVDKIDGEKDVE